jgi:DNA polymerase-3 subunit alpha
MIFFFDTETTGLPPRRVPPTETDKWSDCRIVQIAWELYNPVTKECVKKANYVIRPDNFSIPEGAARIHGITTEIANETGVHMSKVFDDMSSDLADATLAVAHNMSFDDNVLLSELYRYNPNHQLIDVWLKMPKKCTMLMGTPAKQKWPKLTELYTRLFGQAPDATLHRADADVDICAKCYFSLVNSTV